MLHAKALLEARNISNRNLERKKNLMEIVQHLSSPTNLPRLDLESSDQEDPGQHHAADKAMQGRRRNVQRINKIGKSKKSSKEWVTV